MNCHHEFPGLGCCVTPHPEMLKDEIGGMKDEDGSKSLPISDCQVPIDLLPRSNWQLAIGNGSGQNSASSFHTDYLLDLGHDLNQVFLVLHHCFDRFVGARNLIQYANVFTTFNARSLTREVVLREGSLRRTA